MKKETWRTLVRLGEKGFDSPAAAGAFTALLILQQGKIENVENQFSGIDVSEPKTVEEKAMGLVEGEIKRVGQEEQLGNPDARVTLEIQSPIKQLKNYSRSFQGIVSADYPHYGCFFWEQPTLQSKGWAYQQSTVQSTILYGGRSNILFWEDGNGSLSNSPSARIQGLEAWEGKGIAVAQMRLTPVTLHQYSSFDNNTAVIIPHDREYLPIIWCYCSSPEYNEAVRRIDQKLNVTNATLVKVPFDIERWTKVAEEKYPNGLPLPFTDDPTQWIFHGHPCKSVVWDEDAKWTGFGPIRFDSTVLHVAVARLLGYRWPAELDLKMELAKEQRALVQECEALLPLSDNDGIVCIPSVGGEFSASERLLKMLKASYGDAWTDDTLSTLLRNTDTAGKTLENWLRDKFFIQHCKLFGDRPFIWHVWDGLPDGFSALVNYHKLDYKKLETLIYSYLGDWIQRQKTDVTSNVEGAREKLSAAQALSQRLELILKGEKPCDIFVRWKSLEEQPIGWNPDLNDGVRLNIRPFMSVPDIGKKDAGVLRDKPNIKWTKDRGQDVETAPWYNLGPVYEGKKGDRINDHHLSLEEKASARKAGGKR